MSCQTDFPQNSLNLTDGEKILRINPDIESCDLDDYEKMDNLRLIADEVFTERNTEILKFLNIKEEKGEA